MTIMQLNYQSWLNIFLFRSALLIASTNNLRTKYRMGLSNSNNLCSNTTHITFSDFDPSKIFKSIHKHRKTQRPKYISRSLPLFSPLNGNKTAGCRLAGLAPFGSVHSLQTEQCNDDLTKNVK